MTRDHLILRQPQINTNEYMSLSDQKTNLADINAQATLRYSVKDYDAAAELYSQATELQAEINGEMSPDNAELLYAYGRCLYHVAVRHSDVLGSKVSTVEQDGPKEPANKKLKRQHPVKAIEEQEKKVAEEIVNVTVEGKDRARKLEDSLEKNIKPYFQITGDENWDSTEDEDDEDDHNMNQDGDDGTEANEEDDFANAYEVLDLARVLLIKKIEDVEKIAGNGIGIEQSTQVKKLQERLADTYDLQAEISLEGEKFPNAVIDLKSALKLKVALFPQASSVIAEAHYKLSLALEFSSATQEKDATGNLTGKEARVDDLMREEAASEMEAAIMSCRLRIDKEETALFEGKRSDQCVETLKVTADDIQEVKAMVKEMEQRLVELRQPLVLINDPTGTGTFNGSNPLTSVLGALLGETPATQKARLEEASKDAKDLTNLVKKKRPVEHDIFKAEIQGNTVCSEEIEEAGTKKRPRVSNNADG